MLMRMTGRNDKAMRWITDKRIWICVFGAPPFDCRAEREHVLLLFSPRPVGFRVIVSPPPHLRTSVTSRFASSRSFLSEAIWPFSESRSRASSVEWMRAFRIENKESKLRVSWIVVEHWTGG